jgi:hypothetical protein
MRLIIEARLVDGDSDTVEEGDGILTSRTSPSLLQTNGFANAVMSPP